MTRTKPIYLLKVCMDRGETQFQAFANRELARKEVQWYREKYLKGSLDEYSADDLNEMLLTGDFVSEQDRIHLADVLTVEIETVTLVEEA